VSRREASGVAPAPRRPTLPTGRVAAWRSRHSQKAVVVGSPGRELTTIARKISWSRLSKKPMVPVVVVLVAAAMTVFLAVTPGVTRLAGFARGLAAGLASAGIVFALVWFLLISDGSMTWRVGALGEFWTSEELRKLGQKWTVLNGVRVPAADGTMREIDHVAVGPGGVLVVDTKLWPTKTHQLDTTASPEINRAARGAQRQAGVVRWFLSDVVSGDLVSPTVMFWGSDLLSPAEMVVTNRNGVLLVHARDSDAWLKLVAGADRLDPERVVAVIVALQPFLIPERRIRDQKPPAGWVRPPSR